MNETTTNNDANTSLNRSPILLTIEEARAVLRISRWTLYQLLNRQRIKTIYIGRRRLVPADELRAYLDEQRQPGADHER